MNASHPLKQIPGLELESWQQINDKIESCEIGQHP